jgi:glycosyltransferase involved in cell wall biosynthesis
VKILHLSDSAIPDQRVRRSVYTATKNGYECYFAGPTRSDVNFEQEGFKKVFNLKWQPLMKLKIPVLFNKIKSDVNEIIDNIKPNIIHAHDIFAAKLCAELDAPFIFDSHEFWGQDVPIKLRKTSFPLSFFRKFASENIGLALWDRWQKEIVAKVPTVTVSPEIESELKKYGKNVFLLPNFPLKEQVEKIEFRKKKPIFSSVYIGDDITSPSPHRDINYLPKVFSELDKFDLTIIGDNNLHPSKRLNVIGYMNHDKMMSNLTEYHLGLLPWLPHPYHKYCNPNKIADYSHAGLPILITSSLTSAIKFLEGHCYKFDTVEDFKEKIVNLSVDKDKLEASSEEIIEFARENLIWDKYEENLLKAYSLA